MRKKILLICQLFLGGIFIYAGFGKIMNPDVFTEAVRNYQMLPNSLVSIVVYVLPWMELVFGLLLALDIYPRFSAFILTALMGVFIIVILITTIRGIDIRCGCFIQKMAEEKKDWTYNLWLMIRDSLFMIPGLIILKYNSKEKQ